MKFPFLKPRPLDMSEAELESSIRRRDKLLLRDRGRMVMWATLCLMPAACIAALAACGWMFTPLVGVISLGSGVGAFFGSGYAVDRFMKHAHGERKELFLALEAKVEARLEAERLRDLKATDAFNEHVDAGLPLDRSIEVKKALRLKFPPPPVPDSSSGFARIFAPRFRGLEP